MKKIAFSIILLLAFMCVACVMSWYGVVGWCSVVAFVVYIAFCFVDKDK
jgi:hypothetical protein